MSPHEDVTLFFSVQNRRSTKLPLFVRLKKSQKGFHGTEWKFSIKFRFTKFMKMAQRSCFFMYLSFSTEINGPFRGENISC